MAFTIKKILYKYLEKFSLLFQVFTKFKIIDKLFFNLII